MLTDSHTTGSSAAERMKLQTERFLERASRSTIDARRAYERLVRRLHRIGGSEVRTASSPVRTWAAENQCGSLKSVGLQFHGEPQVQPYRAGLKLEDLFAAMST